MSGKEVGAEDIKKAIEGDEFRAFRGKLAQFLASRRRFQGQGYGRVSLVTEFHASRPVNSVEVVDKEAEN